MATMLGSLLVSLGLESAQFKRDLKGAQAEVSKFGNFAKIGMAAAASAAVAAASALTVLVKSSIDTADEISKAAQAIGIGTEELSRLRYAAELSGVSFEQLQTGVGRLSRNMFDAANGSKQAQLAFQRLGIDVMNADGTLRSATDIMGDVADRFANMQDGAEKTALAMQIFGRAGADMIPMLNGGRDALEQLTQEADRFGIVIDAETGRKAEAFNDNLARLKGAFSALATRIAAELLPHLVDFTEWLIRNQDEIVKSIGDIGRYIDAVARAAAAIGSGVNYMHKRFGALYRAVQMVLNPLKTLVLLAERFGLIGGGRGGSGGPVGQTAEGMKALAQNAIASAKAMRTLGIESDSAGRALGGSVAKGASAARAASAPMRDEVKDLVERLFPELGSRAKMAELALLDLAAAQGKISEAIRREGRLRILGVAGDAEVSRDLLEQRPLDAIGDEAKKFVEEFKRDFVRKVRDANKAVAESFGQMADRALQALDRMVNAFRGGNFLDILGSVLNFGLQLGGLGVFGKGFQSRVNARVPGFAGGTRFAPGGLAMVGERGPELVNLPRGSQVIPNRELSSLGGSIKVIPSPYFDVVVDGRIVQASPGIMSGGANLAQSRSARQQSRRI